MGNDSSGGAVKTFVNETGKFLANIPGETNELLSGESESEENDTVGKWGLIDIFPIYEYRDLHNFTGQAPYVVKQFQTFGFLDANITRYGKIMKGTFYENRDGTDKDHFTIAK